MRSNFLKLLTMMKCTTGSAPNWRQTFSFLTTVRLPVSYFTNVTFTSHSDQPGFSHTTRTNFLNSFETESCSKKDGEYAKTFAACLTMSECQHLKFSPSHIFFNAVLKTLPPSESVRALPKWNTRENILPSRRRTDRRSDVHQVRVEKFCTRGVEI